MNDTNRLHNQPKYKIGEAVEVIIITTDKATTLTFENKVIGNISVIKAYGTSEKDTYVYGITLDMPGCWHTGKEPFIYIEEDKIVLNKD